MNISESVLVKLLHKYADISDEKSQSVAGMLDHSSSIQRRVDDLLEKERFECIRHKNAIHSFENIRHNIHQECEHHLTTFYPDAAGGNDSYSRCDVCGKEL